jgi:hypothetical protein
LVKLLGVLKRGATFGASSDSFSSADTVGLSTLAITHKLAATDDFASEILKGCEELGRRTTEPRLVGLHLVADSEYSFTDVGELGKG